MCEGFLFYSTFLLIFYKIIMHADNFVQPNECSFLRCLYDKRKIVRAKQRAVSGKNCIMTNISTYVHICQADFRLTMPSYANLVKNCCNSAACSSSSARMAKIDEYIVSIFQFKFYFQKCNYLLQIISCFVFTWAERSRQGLAGI